jgi:hypothetical protein
MTRRILGLSDFFALFFWGGGVVFLLGVLGKLVFRRGVFVVKVW